MTLAGHPPSTVADLVRAVNDLWAFRADCPSWQAGTTYAVGEMVTSSSTVYLCHAPGVAAEAPSGEGSFRDSADVLWSPIFFVGERHAEMGGAPRRVVFIPRGGQLTGPMHVGGREPAMDAADLDIYVWGAETATSRDRFDDALMLFSQVIESLRAVAPGFIDAGRYVRSDERSVITYGEQIQASVVYRRFLSRTDVIQKALRLYAATARQGPIYPEAPLGPPGIDITPAIDHQPMRVS